VKSDIVLMFHSLGSYWAMAMAHQVRDICSVLQCPVVYCSVLQRVTACYSVMQCDLTLIGEVRTLIHGAGAFRCETFRIPSTWRA